MEKLLTRDAFRVGVFARDGNKCVFCGRKPEETPESKLDAHHILERRLFTAADELGGYFLSNGASVCEDHHLQCEQTVISVEDVRRACGITKPRIPAHMYSDHTYDKWGNIVLENGQRMRGDLFNDESVQKVLRSGGVLDLFTSYVKYPRTYHMPWSQGMNEDDRQWSFEEFMKLFEGKRVVCTEKMDGENTNLYTDYYHARSIDGRNHPSRAWVKNFWGQICGDIPAGWRVCGENLYAKHSISYETLPSYFMGFSVWDDRNVCLSWDETVEWFGLLGVVPVPVLYDGIFDAKAIQALYNERDWETREGYVMRVADAFPYGQFRTSVAKFVRKNHVQTVKHWMHGKPIEPNKMVAA